MTSIQSFDESAQIALVPLSEDEQTIEELTRKSREIEELNFEILEVNELLKEMQGLVESQQSGIDSVENHIESTLNHSEQAYVELVQAEEHQKSYYSKLAYIGGTVITVALIIVGVKKL
jgi:t-SNARE complex subunit (syntaxin)